MRFGSAYFITYEGSRRGRLCVVHALSHRERRTTQCSVFRELRSQMRNGDDAGRRLVCGGNCASKIVADATGTRTMHVPGTWRLGASARRPAAGVRRVRGGRPPLPPATSASSPPSSRRPLFIRLGCSQGRRPRGGGRDARVMGAMAGLATNGVEGTPVVSLSDANMPRRSVLVVLAPWNSVRK